MSDFMKRHRFTFDDQLAFAQLSGDYNPIHVDPAIARRLIFGQPIVHGIHTILWALDNSLDGCTEILDLHVVKAEFQRAIEVGEEISCSHNLQNNKVGIELLTKGARAACFQIDLIPSKGVAFEHLSKKFPEHRTCRTLPIESAAVASGTLDLCLNLDSAAKLFPNLNRIIPSIQLAEILATTRLVGMECPGLHSIYYGLDLVFNSEAESPYKLAWEVTSCNRRFSKLSMKVGTPGMEGTVKAFFRPPPHEQASYKDICEQVNADEFTAQQALIIGGSRGLGEVTAKLLAAGGAKVRITYFSGDKDAYRVVREIVSHGGSADCVAFDVLDPPQDLSGKLWKQWSPTALYYFATPFIFGAVKGIFSSELFQRFCDYYVTGFLNTVETILNLEPDLEFIFYPSSIAIDDLPPKMCEYAAAKIAGEIICDFLKKRHPDIKIHRPRLNRMATDQTASLLPVKNKDPIPIILKNLRHLREPA